MKSYPLTLSNSIWRIFWHYTTGGVESIRLVKDQAMEWVDGRFGLPFGPCFLDKREVIDGGIRLTYEYMVDLRLTVERVLEGEIYKERYTWQNVGKNPLPIKENEVGVYVTFADRGERSDVFWSCRAFTHVMQGSRLYVASCRANGAPDGLALVSTKGQIERVTEEYPTRRDRGELIAYLPALTLEPQEMTSWEWVLFAYDNEQDYRAKSALYAPVWHLDGYWGEVGEKLCLSGVESEDLPPKGQEEPAIVGGSNRLDLNQDEFLTWDGLSMWERVQAAKGGRDGETSLYNAYLLAKIYLAQGGVERDAITALLAKYYRRHKHGLDMMPRAAISLAELGDKLDEQIRFALVRKKGLFNVWQEWGRYCLLCLGEAKGIQGCQEARQTQIILLRPFMKAPWGEKIVGWQDLDKMLSLLG